MKYSVPSWKSAYRTNKKETISDNQAWQVAHGKQADRVESWNKQDINKNFKLTNVSRYCTIFLSHNMSSLDLYYKTVTWYMTLPLLLHQYTILILSIRCVTRLNFQCQKFTQTSGSFRIHGYEINVPFRVIPVTKMKLHGFLVF